MARLQIAELEPIIVNSKMNDEKSPVGRILIVACVDVVVDARWPAMTQGYT